MICTNCTLRTRKNCHDDVALKSRRFALLIFFEQAVKSGTYAERLSTAIKGQILLKYRQYLMKIIKIIKID